MRIHNKQNCKNMLSQQTKGHEVIVSWPNTIAMNVPNNVHSPSILHVIMSESPELAEAVVGLSQLVERH